MSESFQKTNDSLAEYEQQPVPKHKLLGWRYFAGSYAGEHVAGTEFIIGAAFVAWGASTQDILYGLLLGNLMAVLTWALITAPIAVQSRLTLYEYLRQVTGPGFNKIYNVVNALLFCALGGAMITVSASAVRLLFDIPAQTNWYPTSLGFIAVVLLVGAIVVMIAVMGFKKCAQFASLCSPWLLVMFIAGGMASLPALGVIGNNTAFTGWDQFIALADQYIWTGSTPDGSPSLSFWQIAAFAWVCNLAMHGSLGDMSILRFAKRQSYGYFSAFGMFFGHYIAWICAGVMGAAAMLLLKTPINQLDAGGIAYAALGTAGIIAVIIAGWTTSNPTIYRAGLAIQSIIPNRSRAFITCWVGCVTVIIACFPFVFTKLLEFVGYMGLLLAPVGAIIVSEHWLFKLIGLTPFWSQYKGNSINPAALITWATAVLLAVLTEQFGWLHLFFLFVPTYVLSIILYCLLASVCGAKNDFSQAQAAREKQLQQWHDSQQQLAQSEMEQKNNQPAVKRTKPLAIFTSVLAVVSLLAIVFAAIEVWTSQDYLLAIIQFKQFILWSTILYFTCTIVMIVMKKQD